MEELQCFSPEVCEQIKYYVYRLIDPRNGQTFYVGKGKGNRVFAHVNGALKDFNGENFENKDEDSDSPKIQTIREIEQAGLKVIFPTVSVYSIPHLWENNNQGCGYKQRGI